MKRLFAALSLVLLMATSSFGVVSTSARKVAYSCNGVTTAFSFSYPIIDESHLRVVKTDSTDVETVLALGTDYTVSKPGATFANGGTVTVLATCSSGYTLTIKRVTPATQSTDYVENQTFSQNTLESNLDKATMLIQEVAEDVSRAPKLAESSSITDIALPNPSANNYIGWNAGATNLENKASPVATTATQYEVDALISYGGGSSYTQATILSALTAIGTTNKTTLLLRPGTWVISTDADYSLYTNVTWKVVPGALLQIASGKTLTIGGPLEAGLYQVFSGAGTVSFGSGSVKEVNPEWWGIDGTADEVQIEAAMASLPAAGGIVQLLGTTYNIATTLDFTADVDHGVKIKGLAARAGSDLTNATILKWMGAAGGTLVKVDSVQMGGMEDLILNASGTNTAAVTMHLVLTGSASTWNNYFKNIYFAGAPTTAHLRLGSADAVDIAYNVWDNVVFREGVVQVLVDSSNVAANTLRNVSLFGATNTSYNIKINRGGISLDHVYMTGATQQDIYIPATGLYNQYLTGDDVHSESAGTLLFVENQALAKVCHLSNVHSTAAPGADVISWDSPTSLLINGGSLGGANLAVGPNAVAVTIINVSGVTFSGTLTNKLVQIIGNGITAYSDIAAHNGIVSTKGISGTATRANNLRGNLTITGAAVTGAVTFGTAEPDANYFILLSVASHSDATPTAGSTNAYATAKTVNGFNVYVDAAPGGADIVYIDWMIVR